MSGITLGVNGYVTGFRVQESDGANIAELDLFQFGTSDKQSSIKVLKIYDEEIISWLQERYITRKVYSISLQCYHFIDFIKKNEVYVVERVIDFRSRVLEERENRENDGIGSNTAVAAD